MHEPIESEFTPVSQFKDLTLVLDLAPQGQPFHSGQYGEPHQLHRRIKRENRWFVPSLLKVGLGEQITPHSIRLLVVHLDLTRLPAAHGDSRHDQSQQQEPETHVVPRYDNGLQHFG